MVILDKFVNGKKPGYIKVYQDMFGLYTVQVSVVNQKSLYPKVFPSKTTALQNAAWIERNWDYHIKDVDLVKTTPLTYH